MFDGAAPLPAFAPHPWMRSPHLQTLWPLLAPRPRVQPRRERLELGDGDFIDAGWLGERGCGLPVAVLVHGLGGGLESTYVLRMAERLRQLGWLAVAFQLRGAGGSPNRLPKAYHHGDTDDFRWFCRRLRRCEPDVPLVAVGWSLGAGVVLKALGEDGADSPLDGAVAISAPFDLECCAEHLRRAGGFYQALMLRGLKRQALLKHRLHGTSLGIDLQMVLAARDFFMFGDAYTAPLNGFENVHDYCERAACGPYLQAIRRPALVVQAMDDPILGPSCIPPRQPLPRNLDIRMFDNGGHAGFVAQGRGGRPRLWLEEIVPAAMTRWRYTCPAATPDPVLAEPEPVDALPCADRFAASR